MGLEMENIERRVQQTFYWNSVFASLGFFSKSRGDIDNEAAWRQNTMSHRVISTVERQENAYNKNNSRVKN